jgi:hypothetical protein
LLFGAASENKETRQEDERRIADFDAMKFF